MATIRQCLIWVILLAVIALEPLSQVSTDGTDELTVVIQPCLSNNISIMRNNDDSSTEQPTVVTSGYRTDQIHPSDERGLLKFDLSTVPKDYHVKSATLSLYVIEVYTWDGTSWQPVSALSRTIELHAIITDWMGWSFTYWTYATFPKHPWSAAGGDFAPKTASVSEEVAGTWNTWAVTGDVQAWYEGKKPNYGWLLKDAQEGDTVGCRVEYMNWFYVFDITYSPKLEIILEPNPALSLPDSNWIVVAIVIVSVATVVLGLRRLNRKSKIGRDSQGL
jgi:hypothetical protein